MKRLLFLCALTVIACAIVFSQAKRIRIPQDQPTVQAGIDIAANGDTVLIAEGTYLVNVMLTKKIVLGSLYLIDGDTSHISKTILDGSSAYNPHFLTYGSVIFAGAGTDTTTVISGLTITGGRGTLAVDPTSGSQWLAGGGIMSFGSGVKIVHNRIISNGIQSRPDVPYTHGGGVSIGWNPDSIFFSVIEDNRIANNTLNGNAAEGAGIGLGTRARIARNIIENNVAAASNNGMAVGAMSIWAGKGESVVLRDNIIRANSSSMIGGGVTIYQPTTAGGPYVTMTNNLIVGNTAVVAAGAIDLRIGCTLILVNNTIADNAAGWASGLWARGNVSTNSIVVGINNIFWNKGNISDELYGIRFQSMYNNLIRGESAFGENNFFADPQFASDGSYSLTSGSPCLGAGVANKTIFGISLQAPLTDLSSNPRPQPSGTKPDIGALESVLGTTTAGHPNRAEAHSFVFEGINRSYAVIRPKGHESETNQGVIMFLHGYGDNANWAMNYYQLHRVGDSLQFLTVYPEAYDSRWNSGIGDNPAFPTPSTNDVGFISALIDSLQAQYGADTTRVYVAGHSNGGFMAIRLAAQLAHRIRGAAAIAALLPTSIAAGYSATRHIPILLMNGTADPIVPYVGATGWNSASATLDFWRAKNNAIISGDTLTVPNIDPTDQSTVERYRYRTFNGRAMVWFYKITGGGHDWPNAPSYYGAGVINRDIDANWEIYRFMTDPLNGVTVDVSPPIDFGNIIAYASDTARFVVNNLSQNNLRIDSIFHRRSEFTIAALPSFPMTIPRNASVQFKISFRPVADGVVNDTISIASNDSLFPIVKTLVKGRGWATVATALPGVMYGTSVGQPDDQLYKVNTATGEATMIGSVGAPEIQGLAIRPSNGALYGASATSTTTILYRMRADSGTPIWTATLPIGNLSAMAFTHADSLYSISNTGQLYCIDLLTLGTTPVGKSSGRAFSGLAFDPSRRKLWGSVSQPGNNDSLFSINRSTGEVTFEYRTGFPTVTPSIVFDSTGVMYCLVGADGTYLGRLDRTGGQVIGRTWTNNLRTIALSTGRLTNVNELASDLVPQRYQLRQNFPNPFNPSTTIRFDLPVKSKVRLQIFNVLGQQVAELANEEVNVGYFQKVWNANVSSGLYFYRLEAVSVSDPSKRFVDVKKLLFLK